jgi:hypothetical protein
MASQEEHNQTQADATRAFPPEQEPPFSIFDKHQKWLIIAIVSTAATCTFLP